MFSNEHGVAINITPSTISACKRIPFSKPYGWYISTRYTAGEKLGTWDGNDDSKNSIAVFQQRW